MTTLNVNYWWEQTLLSQLKAISVKKINVAIEIFNENLISLKLKDSMRNTFDCQKITIHSTSSINPDHLFTHRTINYHTSHIKMLTATIFIHLNIITLLQLLFDTYIFTWIAVLLSFYRENVYIKDCLAHSRMSISFP